MLHIGVVKEALNKIATLLAVLVFRNKCGNFFSVVFESDTVAKKLGFLVLVVIIRDFTRSVVIVTA